MLYVNVRVLLECGGASQIATLVSVSDYSGRVRDELIFALCCDPYQQINAGRE